MEPRRRRLLAITIGLTLLGATVAIATMSQAGDGRRAGNNNSQGCTTAPTTNAAAPAAAAPDAAAPDAAAPDAAAPDAAAPDAAAPDAAAPDAAAPDADHQHDGAAINGQAVAQAANARAAESSRRRGGNCSPSTSSGPTATPGPVIQPDSPGNSCDNSNLPVHDGFQNGNRCVSTDRGEVPAAENVPQLLIVSAPRFVRANQPFEIRISTRNLNRSFFLPAATGGYYVTRAFLNAEGITVGHAHTAVRLLSSTRVAPDPTPVVAFFKATEDGLGGKAPDTFTVSVPAGIPTPGLYQIISWCGDASHSVPMSQRANQPPCVDAVRLVVGRAR
jgi:hypothetical protein